MAFHTEALAQLMDETRIAVVIPSFKVSREIAKVVQAMGPECWRIYIVDDACPENSGDVAATSIRDPRVKVIRHQRNLGVGGAVMSGYRAAIADGATVIVKIDGDGQMAPELLGSFVAPIVAGEADYAKGNRFFDLAHVSRMPAIRILGNAVLSVMSKFSTGYWNVFDPNNGYTAIAASVARLLPFDKISERYFFETDVLFRLNVLRAVVVDIPMDAVYGNEVSNLRIRRILGEFLAKHVRNFSKRLFYNYFLRDVSIASLELLAGLPLFVFGLSFGAYHWLSSAAAGVATPVGTIMIAVVSVLIGMQLVLSFLNYDIAAVPRRPLHPSLNRRDAARKAARSLEPTDSASTPPP